MKKIVLFLLGLFAGAAMFSMSGLFGAWADRLFFPSQVGLSRAFRALEQGRAEDHQKALRDWILEEHRPPKLRAIALYNLGGYSLAMAGRGDAAAAKDAFFYFKEALRNDPSLIPAKHNLEILLRTAEEKKAREQMNSDKSQPGSPDEGEKNETQGLTVPKPLLGGSP